MLTMTERDTIRYELRDGNEVVYVGITNNPERRAQEHKTNKEFRKMVPIGSEVSRATAEEWETERIQTYKQNHNGNRPKYNQNDSGK